MRLYLYYTFGVIILLVTNLIIKLSQAFPFVVILLERHYPKNGEDLVEKSLKILIEKDNEIFKVLDNQEKEVLGKILKKLVYSLF